MEPMEFRENRVGKAFLELMEYRANKAGKGPAKKERKDSKAGKG
jgi:hypothetical protein